MADQHDVHLGGTLSGASSPESAVGLLGRVSVGYRLAFGGGTIYRIDFSTLNFTTAGISFFGGVRIKAGQTKLEICPTFTYDRSIAEVPIQYVSGLTVTSTSFENLSVSKSIQVAVGRPVWRHGAVELVPTVTLGMGWDDSYPAGFIDGQGRPVRESTVSGTIEAGVGVVIANRIAFTPTVSHAFWLPEDFQAGTIFSVSLGLRLHR